LSSIGGWYDTDWLYCKELVVDYNMIQEDLTDFPVFVDVTDDDLLLHAQSDGDDIVFTNLSGAKLSHEIQLFDSGSGHLVAWVNIPFLSSLEDTVLYMYYGNSLAVNQEDVDGTWNNDFKAVYHLNEDWSTSSGHFKDSSGNEHHGTLTDADGDSSSDVGVAGSGFRFSGDDVVNIGAIDHDEPITYSAWINADDVAQARCALGRYWNGYYLGTWSWGSGVLRKNIYVDYDWSSYSVRSGVKSGEWYLLTVTYDGETIRYYTNDVEDDSQVLVGSLSQTSRPWQIGANGNNGFFFAGIVDEVCIANSAFSSVGLEHIIII